MAPSKSGSLERLKALDNLSNLDLQLVEIEELCSHSAQAEMIAKWLSSKLQSDLHARKRAEAWSVLLKTLRILAPERIPIVGISKILKTAQTALHDNDTDARLLGSLSDVLLFLLEQGKAPSGVAVRASLSLPTTEAAEFAGTWLRSCVAVSELQRDIPNNDISHQISAALQIWDLRKGSSDENEAFSKHCLVPCAMLLSHLDVATPNATKRKRNNASESREDGRRAVESLLARHIFLPSRAAFFKASGSNISKKVGSQRPSFTIESLLEPLRSSEGSSAALLRARPDLLDISLRSSPPLSPRRRAQEKPWIEALFRALADFDNNSHGEALEAKVLPGMLGVTADRNWSLPTDYLTIITDRHAGFNADSTDDLDWDLLAEVIRVDASLFLEPQIALTLCNAVTQASIKAGEDLSTLPIEPELRLATVKSARTMEYLLRDRVVLPILQVFADHRMLLNFLELWSKQLQEDLHSTFWSPWNHIDVPVQSLLESSLTDDQILAACQNCSTTIITFNHQSEARDIPKLSAAIVVLNVLLGGLTGEAVRDKVQLLMQPTFAALVKLFDVHVGPALVTALQERRCWALMTTTFEPWFSRWAVQQEDSATVVSRIIDMVPPSVLGRALTLPPEVQPQEYGSVKDIKSASDARCFAACVCTKLLAYWHSSRAKLLQPFVECLNQLDDTDEVRRSTALISDAGSSDFAENDNDQLRFDHGESDRLHATAFVLYPSALGLLENKVRQILLSRYLKRASSGDSQHAAYLDVVRALISSAIDLVQPQVIEDFVEIALELLSEASGSSTPTPIETTVVIEILSEFPAKALTRTQREKILDIICRPDLHTEQDLKPSIALMLRLMELPNPTARMCVDPAALPALAKALDGSNMLEPDGTIIALLEALASLVIHQCVKTKDQERSRTVLVGLSSEARKTIKSMGTTSDLNAVGAELALTRAIFRDLETSTIVDMRDRFEHREAKAVKQLLKTLTETIGNVVQSIDTSVMSALDMLQAIPPALVSSCGFDVGQVLAKLASFLDTSLPDANASQQLEIVQIRTTTAIMVRCYDVLGRLAPSAPNVALAMFADRLLRLPLAPREHASVLATFESLLARLEGSRVALMQELLDEREQTTKMRLLLIQSCAHRLEKSDFEDFNAFAPTRILHQLLKVASASRDFTVTRRSLSCIIDVLKRKPLMINQYNIEITLQTLHHFTQRPGAGKNILYLDICAAVSALLLHHRSRLQGRFHILIKLFQALLTRLFQPLAGWPDRSTDCHPPTPKHASALARLLKLLCEPPQSHHTRKSTSDSLSHFNLVDESRKQQAHVGTFVQHILHTYCNQILHGTLGEGMKDALTPGVWSMVEAMEVRGNEGGKALSAAMGESERAVLRGVYGEWRRFGKWRGE